MKNGLVKACEDFLCFHLRLGVGAQRDLVTVPASCSEDSTAGRPGYLGKFVWTGQLLGSSIPITLFLAKKYDKEPR